MEYLQKIILNGSLETIEMLVASDGFFTDDNYFDYKALSYALENKKQDAAEFLLSKNCRVNSNLYKAEDTPLHLSLKLADIRLIAILLIKNASITAVNPEGNTPLHLAYLSRCDKIVELMLNYICVLEDSDLSNVRNAQGLTHMHIACTNDRLELVERFLNAGANSNDTVSTDSPYCAGYTALHFAISHNCTKVAKLLLKDGNLLAENSDGLTSFQLTYTITKSSQIIFSHMLKQSEYHKSSLYDRLTYFHMACLSNFSDLLYAFIKNGAEINTPLSKEATLCPLYSPLHCAVESKCMDNVQLLLKVGADVKQRNGYGMTPLHLALYCEDHKEDNTIVDLLYEATTNKEDNCTDNNQLSYFHVAVTRNDIDLVKVLLDERKENVNQSVLRNSRQFSGFTPLHFAVRYGHLEMVKLLINNGACVNDNWSEQGAPLHLAFQAGRKDIVDFLLDSGAKANVRRDNDGKTMLHLLVEYCVDELEARDHLEESSNRWGAEDGLLRYIGKLVDLGCEVNAKDTIHGDTALHLACSRFGRGVHCAILLLELGANVNLVNELGLTALERALDSEYRSNGSDYMALYHHVQQLKTLGIKVNPKNDEFCETILARRAVWEKSTLLSNDVNFFGDDELERRRLERLDEIAKMQSVKLDGKVSLMEFLLLKPKYAAAYAKNTILKELLKDKAVKQLYPLYGYLIRICYWKAVRRFQSKGIFMRKTKRWSTMKTGCIGCVGCRDLK